jgi:hypothetical protein
MRDERLKPTLPKRESTPAARRHADGHLVRPAAEKTAGQRIKKRALAKAQHAGLRIYIWTSQTTFHSRRQGILDVGAAGPGAGYVNVARNTDSRVSSE